LAEGREALCTKVRKADTLASMGWKSLVASIAVIATACSSGTSSNNDGGTNDSGTGSCNSDPLKTNLAPLFNGNSVDMYDCDILTFTAKYAEPDAMVFKAIIYVESRFQFDSVGCTGNTGCCPQSSWTDPECACLGVMQTGPQCGGTSTLGLLPNGH